MEEPFKQTKGTDYPDKQDKPFEQTKGTDYPANNTTPEPPPQAPGGTPTPPTEPPLPPPSAPAAAAGGGVKIVFWVVGILVVAGVVGGVVIFNRIRSRIPVSFDKDKIVIEDDSGKLEIDVKAQLPDDFPSDIPIYPQSDLTSSSRFIDKDGNTGRGSVFEWRTDASFLSVKDFYLAALEVQGWDVVVLTDESELLLITAKKGEDRGLSYLIDSADGIVRIALTFVGTL